MFTTVYSQALFLEEDASGRAAPRVILNLGKGWECGEGEGRHESIVKLAALQGHRALPEIQLNERNAHFQHHQETGLSLITFRSYTEQVYYIYYFVAHSLWERFPATPLLTIVFRQ